MGWIVTIVQALALGIVVLVLSLMLAAAVLFVSGAVNPDNDNAGEE
jgi:hypothetical protein